MGFTLVEEIFLEWLWVLGYWLSLWMMILTLTERSRVPELAEGVFVFFCIISVPERSRGGLGFVVGRHFGLEIIMSYELWIMNASSWATKDEESKDECVHSHTPLPLCISGALGEWFSPKVGSIQISIFQGLKPAIWCVHLLEIFSIAISVLCRRWFCRARWLQPRDREWWILKPNKFTTKY
jgi:hypothetical protein